MENNYPILKVHMLGGFYVTYGGSPVSFGRNSMTKVFKLLQLLLYYKDNGIAREQLIENIYGRGELADVSNNLRVTVHRLKKILTEAGLPEHDYVHIKKGIYQWDSPMDVEIDAFVFADLVSKGKEAETDQEKKELFLKACKMYKGEFLPSLSSEEWVVFESVQYKNMYFDALRWLCEYLKNEKEHEAILELCTPACEMYPFDEWQAVKIESYIALNRFKEAIKEYEDTSKLFFEELGIAPSEKIMSMFAEMSGHINIAPHAVKEIKDGLKEGNMEKGAFYCNFPSFRDGYRMMSRVIERSGQSAYLSVCTITDGKGFPVENEEKLEVMADELHNTLRNCLRRGDSFTRYSQSQFLILLVGTNQENCNIVYERIRKLYSVVHKSWGKCLNFHESSIAEVENGRETMSFSKDKNLWN